jgi:hypothetical protein
VCNGTVRQWAVGRGGGGGAASVKQSADGIRGDRLLEEGQGGGGRQ